MPASKQNAADGNDFVPRTVAVSGVIAGLVATALAGAGHADWAVAFAGGATLGAVLLWSWEIVVRRAFAPEIVFGIKGVAGADGCIPPKKFGGKAALIVVALIKYPAVGVLIGWAVRHLTPTQVMAGVGGFVLGQFLIGLRGVGGALFPRRSF